MRRQVSKPCFLAATFVVLILCDPVWPDDAPRVVEIFPENDATDVDPTITELWVRFDQDMDTSGFSFCGGGPTFPESGGKTAWVSKQKIVMKVRLEPDHDYQMWLNCPSAQNFRSTGGTPLESVPWRFSTASKTPKLGKKEQRKLNKQCLKELVRLLRDHYSYYRLRDIDWKGLEKKHAKKIVAATSTRSWIKKVAKMLAPAKDMHLWITYSGQTTPTYTRTITPNYDFDGIKAVLPGFTRRNDCVYTAKTDDNIGYIMITTLSRDNAAELEQVQGFLEEFRDCKAMIVDLRPNGGGAEPLAEPIAAWFVKGEKVYAKHVYRDREAAGGFGPVNERKIRGNEEPRRFDKPVAVLSGPSIMSSCEAFLLMMKQGENVTLVGLPSFGSSANPKPHVLKNGAEVFIPSWKAMAPDGTCFEGEGIKPDVTVKAKPSAFKKGDPVIERALTVLRKKTTG
ncbi:MAG: hypothetical protein JXQ75_10350 [Phycisphaerae bacterium]|nr:hypothetical protein [Phycisphaerae bacterium]